MPSAQVKVGGVYLYTNFEEKTLCSAVRKALRDVGPGNWTDDELVTAAVATRMDAAEPADYNFGIGTMRHADIEYLIELHAEEGIVSIRPHDQNLMVLGAGGAWSFEAYLDTTFGQWSEVVVIADQEPPETKTWR